MPRQISSYMLQYGSVDYTALLNSPYDLIITEAAPLPLPGSVPQLTAAQVLALQAQGRTVVGYVNVAVTDQFRSYWNPAWTVDGTDTGTLTASAPAWLVGQPANAFGRIANYSNLDWQAIVIAQAKDLINRGYDGIFLDDVAVYFALGTNEATRRTLATQMANFVARIATEIRAINPNAYIVANSDPYLPGNVTLDAAGDSARQAFLQAVDAHLLENTDADAIRIAETSLAGETILLLFSNGNPSISLTEAWQRGIPYYSPTEAYNALGSFVGPGTDGNDVITGGDGPNFLRGFAGIDTINGGGARDFIFGEEGNDTLNGDSGIDYIVGGTGNDTINGGADADEIYGQDGDDVLTGGSTFDTDIIVGGNGNDTIYGNSALGDYDWLYGNLGDDIFYVDTPADLVFEQAGEGIDIVYANINGAGFYLYDNIENLILLGNTPFGVGNALANTLTGNAIGNYLLGGAGNDILDGAGGNDVLFGEAGNDVFIFTQGTGSDVIADFTRGQDRIDISSYGLTFAQLQSRFAQVGGDGAIQFANGDVIILNSVTMSQLTATDFILAAPNEAQNKIVAVGPIGEELMTDNGLVRWGQMHFDQLV
jgi:uncharacterized protein (TIGR01370 family)